MVKEIDVDKFSDAELRTKLLEFGFPVMPITGTTRKVMAKKLKFLLENKSKAASSDSSGRRSLGRYSSEEESDIEVKSAKKDKRRITMAAPPITKAAKKAIIEPEPLPPSPKKRESRNATVTTTTTSTRSSRILKQAHDDFDTGSDSESDIVVSSNKFENDNDVEYRRSSPFKSPTLSTSFGSRYSPPMASEPTYTPERNTFATSTSRQTFGSPSLASEYAADRLNQIRSRLSLGSPSYDRPATYTSPIVTQELDEKPETPFLSNFTRRLSALSGSKKPVSNSKNDMVKEHDSNGTSYGRSYLQNFRANKGREAIYDYKSGKLNGKNNYISMAVLVGAGLFFVFLAIVYLGLRSDTSMITSGFIKPLCVFGDSHSKKGVNCITEDDATQAVNLLNVIKPELMKRSVAHKCFDPKIKPHMTESEIVTFCQSNFGIKDPVVIKTDLRNLEVMLFANPEWGLKIVQTASNDGVVFEENAARNMEQVIFNRDHKLTSLVIFNPDLPWKCTFYQSMTTILRTILFVGAIFVTLYAANVGFKYYRQVQHKKREEVMFLVEKILEIMQNAAEESGENFLVINHVRDMILSVKDRKDKKQSWESAVEYINEHESRIRTEVQTVQGESFEVWRWIGSNLNRSGDVTEFKYRPGRRIVDVQYMVDSVLQFPHRKFFYFCSSKDVEIKHEICEGFFSVYLLICNRCKKEHPVCSEEPKSELLDVNLAIVAGIASLGFSLFQLNELCSSIHIPPISKKEFDQYLDEIHEIYKDSNSESNLSDCKSNESSTFLECELLASTPKKLSVIDKQEVERLSNTINDVIESIDHLDDIDKTKTFLDELGRDIDKIELLTQAQRNEELWFTERKKRLTASNFGRVFKLQDKTNRSTLVRELLHSTFNGNTYTKYGQDNEDQALQDFEEITGKKIVKCGLFINKDYPFLAASPDGLVLNENSLVEVKCPYKARNSTIPEAISNKEIQFATFSNNVLKLKRDDRYYYQVQGQIFVTGKEGCYFVVWTPKGIAYEYIKRDLDCWDQMFPKLERFYFDHLLPGILKEM